MGRKPLSEEDRMNRRRIANIKANKKYQQSENYKLYKSNYNSKKYLSELIDRFIEEASLIVQDEDDFLELKNEIENCDNTKELRKYAKKYLVCI